VRTNTKPLKARWALAPLRKWGGNSPLVLNREANAAGCTWQREQKKRKKQISPNQNFRRSERKTNFSKENQERKQSKLKNVWCVGLWDDCWWATLGSCNLNEFSDIKKLPAKRGGANPLAGGDKAPTGGDCARRSSTGRGPRQNELSFALTRIRDSRRMQSP